MDRTRLTVLALGVLLGLTGCGGDDGAARPSPSVATPAESEAATSEPPAPGGNGDDGEGAEGTDGRSYQVREGDTLSAIAQRFDTTVRALVEANDLDDPDRIRVGQRLRIPRGG